MFKIKLALLNKIYNWSK